jgi:hypothetical protein
MRCASMSAVHVTYCAIATPCVPLAVVTGMEV